MPNLTALGGLFENLFQLADESAPSLNNCRTIFLWSICLWPSGFFSQAI